MRPARELHQLAVGVPADPHRPVAERREQVEGLPWLRAGREIASQHDPAGASHLGLGQHALQRGQDPVNVGQDRNLVSWGPAV